MTRRNFIAASAAAALGPLSAAGRPEDYIIVEGHRDIWELSDRFKIRDKSQHSPIRDFLVPRLIDGGLSVVIMPAGGDSIEERDGNQPLFEGSMRTLDMILVEIEKTNGKASIIKTKSDIPSQPNRGKVQFFLDLEGGGSIEITPSRNTTPTAASPCCASFSGSACAACNSRTTAATSSATASAAANWDPGSRPSASRWSAR